MKSLLPKAAPFPPLTPDSDSSSHGAALQKWANRVLTLVALFGAIGATCSYVGWQTFGPGPRMATAEARIDTNQRAIASLRTELADTRRDLQTSIYIGCELLKIQQPTAIPLQECSDAEQRRNGR